MSDIDPFPAPPDPPTDPPTGVSADPGRERRRSPLGIWIGLAMLVLVLGVAALALTGTEDDAPAASSGGSSSQTSSIAADGAVSIEGEPRTTAIPEGASIPEWSGPTLEGATFGWSERPKGPIVLAIWAPWCPHCQAELPRLSAAIERHPGVSLVTIATATDRAGPTPQEYMASEGLTFPVTLDDRKGTLAAGLRVQGFPTTYFVDASGLVLASAAGELDPSALDEVLTFIEGS